MKKVQIKNRIKRVKVSKTVNSKRLKVKTQGGIMANNFQTVVAQNDSQLLQRFEAQLILVATAILADPAQAEHKQRLANNIHNIRSKRTLYAQSFRDKGIASLTVDFTAFDISAVSNTVPCRITATGHPFVAGDVVLLQGGDLPNELNGNTFGVMAVATDVADLSDYNTGYPLNASNFAAYSTGGKVQLAIATEANINGIVSALFADEKFVLDMLDL